MTALLGAAALLAVTATPASADCHAAPQPQTVAGARSATYKSASGQSLRLHLFLPRSTESQSAPAVLFFFGGGWRSGRIDQFVPQAKALSDLGIVSAVADYRVHCRQGTGVAEAIADANDAVAWLRNHAARYHVDPHRIAVAGGSAGGHIALATATLPAPAVSRPDALLLFNPVIDVTLPGAQKFAHLPAAEARRLSPAFAPLDALPPTLIIQGADDRTVPAATAEVFCRRARLLHRTCEARFYAGQDHGFFNWWKGTPTGNPLYDRTLSDIERFLTGLGWLSRAPAHGASRSWPAPLSSLGKTQEGTTFGQVEKDRDHGRQAGA